MSDSIQAWWFSYFHSHFIRLNGKFAHVSSSRAQVEFIDIATHLIPSTSYILQMASVNNEKYHYGIDAEIQDKLNAKFNQQDANTALAWIASLAGASVAPNANFQETLKSGVLLCEAANALSPNAVKRIN